MTLISTLSRFVRRYVFSAEVLILCVLLFLVYNTGRLHVEPLRKYFQKARIKLQLKWNGRYDQIPEESEAEVTEKKTKASWDLRKGNIAIYAIQGRRNHMEDRYNFINNLDETHASIYGVFDGHGGEFAADFAEKVLFKNLMVRLLKIPKDEDSASMPTILKEEFLNVDQQFLDIAKSSMDMSGSTALVAILRNGILTVANVGDSRGVMCDKDGNTIPLTVDHKPQQVKERSRIKEAGGYISFNGVWRVVGVLATSRALGDYQLKEKKFLIAEPDIYTFDLTEIQPKFIILATDGLWDCFTNEEAVNYIQERLNEPHYGAKSLVLQAYYKGSLDNITVMVVNFHAASASLYQSNHDGTATENFYKY
ncbi:protein phosphatase 1L-like [Argonauta hians]